MNLSLKPTHLISLWTNALSTYLRRRWLKVS